MGMWNRDNWHVSFELMTSAVLIAAATSVLWNGLTTTPPPPQVQLPTELQRLNEMHVRGNLDAGVAFIVYSDFQCPFCGRFARDILPELERRYVAPGRVILAFRHSPIERIHPFALKASEAAECAARQGRFWLMHDALFQPDLALDGPGLLRAARSAGLNIGEAVSCFEEDGSAKIRADRQSAVALGLTGTPAFLFGVVGSGSVRVQQVLRGARPVEDFAKILDDLLFQTD